MGENASVNGKWRFAGFGWQSEGILQQIGIFTTSGMVQGCALPTRNGEAVESRKIVLDSAAVLGHTYVIVTDLRLKRS